MNPLPKSWGRRAYVIAARMERLKGIASRNRRLELSDIPPRFKRLGARIISRICHGCGDEYQTHSLAKRRVYCGTCWLESHYARQDALFEVGRAIRLGRLMRADQFRCADCPEWAEVWEHRDYSKPLHVEAVCQSCNMKRPSAYRRGQLEFGRPA